MLSKQQRWDQRYQEKTLTDLTPAYVLTQNLHLLPASGDALELASGLGANSVCLAKAGLNVTAIDYSQVALDRLATYARQHALPIQTSCADLEQDVFVLPAADVIVVSYYLYRPMLPRIIDALKPEGLLFYQTFCGKFNGKGPENPAFRFSPGELLQLCQGLDVLYYQEHDAETTDDSAAGDFAGETMIVARKMSE